jgi:hypothetical protein
MGNFGTPIYHIGKYSLLSGLGAGIALAYLDYTTFGLPSAAFGTLTSPIYGAFAGTTAVLPTLYLQRAADDVFGRLDATTFMSLGLAINFVLSSALMAIMAYLGTLNSLPWVGLAAGVLFMSIYIGRSPS